MKIKYPMIGALAALTGCASWIPSVGPSYEEPAMKANLNALPDAGLPTTNLTDTCEYRAAQSNEDVRVVISEDTLAQWWKRFNDPVLERLVQSAVTNNLSFKMAEARLAQANWELLGSYAAFMP